MCDNKPAKKPTENNLGGSDTCLNTGICGKTIRTNQCTNAKKIGDSGCGTIDAVNYTPQSWEVGWLNPKITDGTLTLRPNIARGSWCAWQSIPAPYAIGVCLKIEPQSGFKINGVVPPIHYMIAVDGNGTADSQFADIHTNTSYPGGKEGQKLIDDYGAGCMKNNDANNNALKWTVVDPSNCYTNTNAKGIIPFYKN